MTDEEKIANRIRIGSMIAEIRKSRGLSLDEVSQKAKVDLSNLSKIERGRYNVGIDILGRIADALMVELEFKGIGYIMGIEERLKVLADGEPCFIQREFEVNEDATMYHFICGGTEESACIVYNDGTLFHQYDWQSGRPKTVEEIEDYNWIREDGVEAINFMGLPRVLE